MSTTTTTTKGVRASTSRSKSGCLTCRKRHVRCDEIRPNCHRCSKGTRDCVWPRQLKNRDQSAFSSSSPSSSVDHHDSPPQLELLESRLLNYSVDSTAAHNNYPWMMSSTADADSVHVHMMHFIESLVVFTLKDNRWCSLRVMLDALTNHSPNLGLAPLAFSGQHLAALQGRPATEEVVVKQHRIAREAFQEMLDNPECSGLDLVSWKENMLITSMFFVMYEIKVGSATGVVTSLGLAMKVLTHRLFGCDRDNTLDFRLARGPWKLSSPRLIHQTIRRLMSFDIRANISGLGTGAVTNWILELALLDPLLNTGLGTLGGRYGPDYPVEQISCDIESHSLMELRQKFKNIQHNLAEVAASKRHSKTPMATTPVTEDLTDSLAIIAARLTTIQSEHSNLFALAYATPRIPVENRRRVHTFAGVVVSEYEATWLFWQRLAYPGAAVGDDSEERVDKLISILSANQVANEIHLLHCIWPLVYTAIETTDILQRNWVLDSLSRLRRHGIDIARSHDLTKEICRLQDERGHRVEVTSVMQSLGGLFCIPQF